MEKIVNYENYANIKASDFKKHPVLLCDGILLISLPIFNSTIFKNRPGSTKQSFNKWCEESYTQMSSNEIRERLREYKEWALDYISDLIKDIEINSIAVIAPENEKQSSTTASDYERNNEMISFYERMNNFTSDAISDTFDKKTKISYFRYKSPVDLGDYIDSLF